jgi:hypothetical protein
MSNLRASKEGDETANFAALGATVSRHRDQASRQLYLAWQQRPASADSCEASRFVGAGGARSLRSALAKECTETRPAVLPPVPAVIAGIVSVQGGAAIAKGLFPVLGATGRRGCASPSRRSCCSPRSGRR